MSEEKHASVFIKVAMYLFDVGSDWVTGGIMLSDDQMIGFKNTTHSTNEIAVNGSIANDTIACMQEKWCTGSAILMGSHFQ